MLFQYFPSSYSMQATMPTAHSTIASPLSCDHNNVCIPCYPLPVPFAAESPAIPLTSLLQMASGHFPLHKSTEICTKQQTQHLFPSSYQFILNPTWIFKFWIPILTLWFELQAQILNEGEYRVSPLQASAKHRSSSSLIILSLFPISLLSK